MCILRTGPYFTKKANISGTNDAIDLKFCMVIATVSIYHRAKFQVDTMFGSRDISIHSKIRTGL